MARRAAVRQAQLFGKRIEICWLIKYLHTQGISRARTLIFFRAFFLLGFVVSANIGNTFWLFYSHGRMTAEHIYIYIYIYIYTRASGALCPAVLQGGDTLRRRGPVTHVAYIYIYIYIHKDFRTLGFGSRMSSQPNGEGSSPYGRFSQ